MQTMNLLLYDWQSQSQYDLKEALENMAGVSVIEFDDKIADYNEDPVFEQRLSHLLKKRQCRVCISFNFFPVISGVCQREDVLYISWIYDSPHVTLYSPQIRNSCNVIFSFDRMQCSELKKIGAVNVFHLPLAVNVQRLDRLRMQKGILASSEKKYDISFVGSLYEENYYERIHYIPPLLKGYLDGICRAQMQFFGVDLLTGLLTEEVVEKLKEYVKLDMDPSYFITYEQLFSELFLKKYISSLERKERLEKLSRISRVSLFTQSAWSEEGVDNYGTVDYRSRMPVIFALSGLNINMTIRSITSGIPLRCMDIMGAGGFLFSNYQPELEEYFEPDTEWVSFRGEDEMIDKAFFYLQHDEIRNEIVEKGYQKVKACFTYDKAMENMFRVIRNMF